VFMKFKFTFKLYSMFVVLTTVRYSMSVSLIFLLEYKCEIKVVAQLHWKVVNIGH